MRQTEHRPAIAAGELITWNFFIQQYRNQHNKLVKLNDKKTYTANGKASNNHDY